MKFPRIHHGQLGVLLTLSVVFTGCQTKEEFFPTSLFIEGPDSYCSQANSLEECQALAGHCQPAFHPSKNENEEPLFAQCVANPDAWDDNTTSGASAGSSGGSSSGSDGGSSSGSDGGSSSGSDGGSSSGSNGGSSSGSNGGANGGSSSGSNGGANGGSSSGSNGGSDGGDDDAPPTITDAYKSKCKNLPAEYLWVMKEVTNNQVTKKTVKVKVCHMTGNGDSHTIVIACPALKAHTHHDDYLGACQQ